MDEPQVEVDNNKDLEESMKLFREPNMDLRAELMGTGIRARRVNAFGKLIFDTREKMSLNLSTLSTLSGISVTTLSRWERGELPNSISEEKLQRLADALEIPYGILSLRYMAATKLMADRADIKDQLEDKLVQFHQFLRSINIQRNPASADVYDMAESAVKVLIKTEL